MVWQTNNDRSLELVLITPVRQHQCFGFRTVAGVRHAFNLGDFKVSQESDEPRSRVCRKQAAVNEFDASDIGTVLKHGDSARYALVNEVRGFECAGRLGPFRYYDDVGECERLVHDQCTTGRSKERLVEDKAERKCCQQKGASKAFSASQNHAICLQCRMRPMKLSPSFAVLRGRPEKDRTHHTILNN